MLCDMKRLLIGLDEAVIALIDARRGLVPRVTYIRKLVMDGLGDTSALVERTPPETFAKSSNAAPFKSRLKGEWKAP